eukprot:1965313-Prymnesium_polylepis.1
MMCGPFLGACRAAKSTNLTFREVRAPAVILILSDMSADRLDGKRQPVACRDVASSSASAELPCVSAECVWRILASMCCAS